MHACSLSCLVRWRAGETSVALEDRVALQPFITERDVVYWRFHRLFLSFCLFECLSLFLSVSLSVCLFVCLSVLLSICLFVSLSGMSSVVHHEGRVRRSDFLS